MTKTQTNYQRVSDFVRNTEYHGRAARNVTAEKPSKRWKKREKVISDMLDAVPGGYGTFSQKTTRVGGILGLFGLVKWEALYAEQSLASNQITIATGYSFGHTLGASAALRACANSVR